MSRFVRKTVTRHVIGRLGAALVAILWMMQPHAGNAAGASIETIAREAILMDVATGAILFEKDADQPMHPASMSKMMTVHMLFDRLKEGSLSLDDTFTVSEHAWREGGAKSGSSTMFLMPGQRVRVEDLIRGIVIQSGNDASIVVAEGLASSEQVFAEQMTARAHKLGLNHSTFRNATGLPDPEHLTTAHDLALLAMETIRDFPEYYHYYSEKEFTYNGIKQGNRNPLLYLDMGVDGLKTGHTEASGYGLTASAKRGDRRLVLVLNGLPSIKMRSRESERLLEWGFREFENYKLFAAGDTVADANVWLGREKSVSLVTPKDLVVMLPRKARGGMKVTATFDSPIAAPITKGDKLAKLVITAPDVAPIEVPLVAGASVERLGIFGRLGAALKYLLWGNAG